ncbi:hypothetical protein JOF56_006168 [Kibdelosporangium banguiense]|uniref:DUF3800 domain-containing protein n=1 Tax=Kibdelosporangium banguiense TaxID=1365924 RepID=A0ABS4TMZ8_9PSEU|nr:DUF3800 domain-containing protein [Kibdelosporangium banguiense]MBP2325783.1 hypothetical protein [Kibdelosporangium banguiense]
MPTEIACDESGSEGGNLIGAITDVFAHASVRLSIESAEECIHRLRRRIRSPALEYKANHLLREKHRAVLVWLLSPHGPIHGNARVHLVEKTFFVTEKFAELAAPSLDARTLYRAGWQALGPRRWLAFLKSFNDLVRSQPGLIALDLHIPAIAQAVAHWSAEGDPVAVVHDRQNLLTEERLLQLKQTLGGRLTGLRFADSRDDARVQIADFLAGVARRIASDELNGHGDAELVELLRSYVDPASTWGDERSWAALRPR